MYCPSEFIVIHVAHYSKHLVLFSVYYIVLVNPPEVDVYKLDQLLSRILTVNYFCFPTCISKWRLLHHIFQKSWVQMLRVFVYFYPCSWVILSLLYTI
ncbi:unnamed protein product [Schistosoma rodhaini]|nr:unnamed protein product [Schistosoma rodhaini]